MTDEHEHRFNMEFIERAPTAGGGHTSFYVCVCRCGHTDTFPRENFALTTPEFQRSFTLRLEVEGCRIVAGEAVREALEALGDEDDGPDDDEERVRRLTRAREIIQAALQQMVKDK